MVDYHLRDIKSNPDYQNWRRRIIDVTYDSFLPIFEQIEFNVTGPVPLEERNAYGGLSERT